MNFSIIPSVVLPTVVTVNGDSVVGDSRDSLSVPLWTIGLLVISDWWKEREEHGSARALTFKGCWWWRCNIPIRFAIDVSHCDWKYWMV